MCYMQAPVLSRIRCLASALEVPLEEGSTANQNEEQMPERLDGMTLFVQIYNDYTPYGVAQWLRPNVVEELRAYGVITLEEFVEFRAFEIRGFAIDKLPPSMEGVNEVAWGEDLPFAEEELREEDGESAETMETGGEVDMRDADAEERNGMSHGDVAGSQSSEPLTTHSGPRAMMPSEALPTLMEISTASSQVAGVDDGSETREQHPESNDNGDIPPSENMQ